MNFFFHFLPHPSPLPTSTSLSTSKERELLFEHRIITDTDGLKIAIVPDMVADHGIIQISIFDDAIALD